MEDKAKALLAQGFDPTNTKINGISISEAASGKAEDCTDCDDQKLSKATKSKAQAKEIDDAGSSKSTVTKSK